MNKAIDTLNQKNEQVEKHNCNLTTLYQTIVQDKESLESKLLLLSQEKERTENLLIKKAMKFAELSEEVDLEKSKLLKQ